MIGTLLLLSVALAGPVLSGQSGAAIGVSGGAEAWDADLDTYATLPPSAFVQTTLDDSTAAVFRATTGASAITFAAYASCSTTNDGDLCFATDSPLAIYRTGGSNVTRLLGTLTTGGAFTVPTTSTFGTTIGSATLSNQGGLVVTGAATATTTIRGATTAVTSAPFRVTACFTGPALNLNAGGDCGIMAGNDTLLTGCVIRGGDSEGWQVAFDNWTTNLLYASTNASFSGGEDLAYAPVTCLQYYDDATNKGCRYMQPDGTFQLVGAAVGRTTHVTATKVGVWTEFADAAYPTTCKFLSWSQSSGATGW